MHNRDYKSNQQSAGYYKDLFFSCNIAKYTIKNPELSSD